jgi:hypothetical protein
MVMQMAAVGFSILGATIPSGKEDVKGIRRDLPLQLRKLFKA